MHGEVPRSSLPGSQVPSEPENRELPGEPPSKLAMFLTLIVALSALALVGGFFAHMIVDIARFSWELWGSI